ncbi:MULTISPECIES: hypothetical protein [Miniimonas]|nr:MULTISPECIES: hypothetical protein [Miniimonas]
MFAVVALVLIVAAAAAGTWYELKHDGSRRRAFDPMYNSRSPR